MCLIALCCLTTPVSPNRVAGLQQEVASLRAKVKGAKEKARSYEGQVAGMASMRAELEQQQHAMRSELRSVKAEVRKEGAPLQGRLECLLHGHMCTAMSAT